MPKNTNHQITSEETINSFSEQWEPWFRGGISEIDELEKNETSWQFNAIRCRCAELYASLDMQASEAILSCDLDIGEMLKFQKVLGKTSS